MSQQKLQRDCRDGNEYKHHLFHWVRIVYEFAMTKRTVWYCAKRQETAFARKCFGAKEPTL